MISGFVQPKDRSTMKALFLTIEQPQRDQLPVLSRRQHHGVKKTCHRRATNSGRALEKRGLGPRLKFPTERAKRLELGYFRQSDFDHGQNDQPACSPEPSITRSDGGPTLAAGPTAVGRGAAVTPLTLLHVFPSFDVGGQQTRFVTIANRLGRTMRHHLVSLDGRDDAVALLDPKLDFELLPQPPATPDLLRRMHRI